MLNAIDLIYDDVFLSDLGYMLCSFNGDWTKLTTLPVGSEFAPETISYRDNTYPIIRSAYNGAASTTIQICKKVDEGELLTPIDDYDFRDLSQLFLRHNYQKLYIVNDNDRVAHWQALCTNMRVIACNGKMWGVELDFLADSPYAYGEPVTVSKTVTETDNTFYIVSESDEEGIIYPKFEITANADGNLWLTNADFEGQTTYLAHLTKGETVTLDYPMISTDNFQHHFKIQNDFSWQFPKLSTTFRQKQNKYTCTLPATIKVTYTPLYRLPMF